MRAIGENGRRTAAPNRSADRRHFTTSSKNTILSLYYRERDRWIEVMRHAISLNGSFFNTHRMMQQYVLSAYFL